jgi:hypothetical protein
MFLKLKRRGAGKPLFTCTFHFETVVMRCTVFATTHQLTGKWEQ